MRCSPLPVVADILWIKFYTSVNWRGWLSFSSRLITNEKSETFMSRHVAVCIVTAIPTTSKYYRVLLMHPRMPSCWKVSINDIPDKFCCFRFNYCSARCSMRYYPAQRRGALVWTRSDFPPEKRRSYSRQNGPLLPSSPSLCVYQWIICRVAIYPRAIG